MEKVQKAKTKEKKKAEKELEKERQSSTENNSDLEQKEEAIKKGNKMIGMTEVTGAGVIVTLSDSKKDTNTALNISDLLVHDADVLSVINELKNAVLASFLLSLNVTITPAPVTSVIPIILFPCLISSSFCSK